MKISSKKRTVSLKELKKRLNDWTSNESIWVTIDLGREACLEAEKMIKKAGRSFIFQYGPPVRYYIY